MMMIDLKVIKQGHLLYDMEPSILPSYYVENPLLTILKNWQLVSDKAEEYLATLDQNFQQETQKSILFTQQLNEIKKGIENLREISEFEISSDSLNDQQATWNQNKVHPSFGDTIDETLVSLDLNISDSAPIIRGSKNQNSRFLGYWNELKNLVKSYKSIIKEKNLKDQENLMILKENLANLYAGNKLKENFFLPFPKMRISQSSKKNGRNTEKSKF